MDDFIKHYARISDMGEDQVVKLLDIQDKQDTRYSRVKTCKELWDIQAEQIQALQKENELLRECVKNYGTQLDLATKHFMDRKDNEKRSLHESICLWKISLKATIDRLLGGER